MNQTELQKNLDYILEKIKPFDPDQVILFGSYAWGKPGKDSDVDIFVIKETDNARKEAIRMSGSVFPRLFAMDLMVYTPNKVKKRMKMGDFFIKDVINKGKKIYDREQRTLSRMAN